MSAGKFRKEHNCLNCGYHVEEHYCSRCGQANLELKESFWSFLSHSIAHYFHFDNKFFKTLKPLLFKPGFTTLEYLQGKRTRYINPINLYIFVSVFYFLITGITNSHTEKRTAKADYKKQENIWETSPTTEFKAGDKNDKLATDTNGAIKNEIVSDGKNNFSFDFSFEPKTTTIEQEKVIQDKLEHNRPKQYFLFMPLMALFVMLNFRKNHFYYLDHLIFTIHGMTAFFVVQIFSKPISHYLFGEESLATTILEYAVLIWIIWYMYFGLKTFYQRSRATTLWRMLWIFVLYGLSLWLSESILKNIIYYTTF
jgi:hypothetical protein